MYAVMFGVGDVPEIILTSNFPRAYRPCVLERIHAIYGNRKWLSTIKEDLFWGVCG